MGVDTKGVIEIKDGSAEEFFQVMDSVRQACYEWVVNDFEKQFPNASDEHRIELLALPNDQFKRPLSFDSLNTMGGVVGTSLNFIFSGESRSLFVCGPTADHGAFEGKGICLILGYWGQSVEIMIHILSHVSKNLELRTFIDENDCDSEGWYEITSEGEEDE